MTVHYSSIDENPLPGISYYRLKQTDIDGMVTFSFVRTVNINKQNAITIYPNPATDQIIITGVRPEKLSILLFNSSGQRMNIPANTNRNGATLNVSGIQPGIYFIQISQGNSTEIKKITIQRR